MLHFNRFAASISILLLIPPAFAGQKKPRDPAAQDSPVLIQGSASEISSPPHPAQLPPPAVLENTKTSQWHLTFSDEFDGSLLNRCWKHSYIHGVRTLKANGEEQYYAEPGEIAGFDPLHLKDGILYINAAPTPHAALNKADRQPYLSGMIMSDGCFAQKFGYFEIRTRVPEGRGLWPAFWLLPARHMWPPEIDIFEMFGAPNSRKEGGVGQVHTGTLDGRTKSVNAWHTVPVNQYDSFHTYGLLWEPEKMTFYVDGQSIATQPVSEALKKKMYLIVNLALGGKWVESPDASTQFPAYMAVDYIRVWQYEPWRTEGD